MYNIKWTTVRCIFSHLNLQVWVWRHQVHVLLWKHHREITNILLWLHWGDGGWPVCRYVLHIALALSKQPTFSLSLTTDFTSLTGIGYFTLPYLVHAGAAHVHACEWNPDAVSALQRNLHINKVVHRCTVHQGDNQQVRIYLSTFAYQ